MQCRQLRVTASVSFIGALAIGIAAIVAATQAGALPISPTYIALGVVAAIGIPVALRYPDIAVVSLIVADLGKFSEVTSDLVGVGVFQPLLILAIASLLLGLASGRLRVRWSLFYLFVLTLAAVVAASVLAAGAGEIGMEALLELSKDLVYLGVLLVWATTRPSWRLATWALVATFAALAALTIVQEFVFNNNTTFMGLSNVQTTQTGAITERHSGPELDANFWARSLALALPITLSWLALSKRGRARWLTGGALAAIAGGLYLTQSRGGMMASIGAAAIWLILAGRPYARLLTLAPVALAIVLVIPGVGSRLITLTESVEDPSLAGRVGAQETGIGMFLDQPLAGVGYGEFATTVPEYQRELGIQGDVLDAHNLYLEIAAETGAIGLTAWALVFGYGLFAALRVLMVSRLGATADDRWNRLMAAGIVAGLLAWLAASVFLHAASLRVAFTMLAVGVGMDIALRGAATTELPHAGQPVPDMSDHDPPGMRLAARSVLAGTATFVLAAAIAWPVLGAAPQQWQADVQVQLRVGDQADGRYVAYSYDLVGRELVGETYAAVLEEPDLIRRVAEDLRWDADATAGLATSTSYSASVQVINIRATAPDAFRARDLAVGVVRHGSTLLADLRQPFVVDAVDAASIRVEPTRPLQPWRIAAVTLLATMAAFAASAAVAYRQRRSPTGPDATARSSVGYR